MPCKPVETENNNSKIKPTEAVGTYVGTFGEVIYVRLHLRRPGLLPLINK